MNNSSIVILGATGAVGGQTLNALLKNQVAKQLLLLGRRPVSEVDESFVQQRKIDIFKPESYADDLNGYDIAICTLGVGEPSKVSKENFVRIDKLAVVNFAKACKAAGIRHFQLLSSVGVSPKSSSFFLRTKGELVEELKALNFERLSIFKPSMILTPKNRYGITQGIILVVWPLISPLFMGGAKKYRGVKVETLGEAFASNVAVEKSGYEELTWADFQELSKQLK